MMKKCFAVVLLLICGTAQAQWVRTNGPGISPATCLAVEGSAVFAGTQSSGLFRSTDHGNIWIASDSGLPANSRIISLLADDPNLFASLEQGVFMSSDRGLHWSKTNLSGSFLVKAQNRIFIGGQYSDDHGAHWSAYDNSQGPDGLTSLGSTLFCSTGDKGVFSSTDQGMHWTACNNGITDHTLLAIATIGETLLASSRYVGVYRSTDSGKSWQNSSDGIQQGHSLFSFAVIGNLVFAGGPQIYVSSDFGSYWTNAHKGIN